MYSHLAACTTLPSHLPLQRLKRTPRHAEAPQLPHTICLRRSMHCRACLRRSPAQPVPAQHAIQRPGPLLPASSRRGQRRDGAGMDGEGPKQRWGHRRAAARDGHSACMLPLACYMGPAPVVVSVARAQYIDTRYLHSSSSTSAANLLFGDGCNGKSSQSTPPPPKHPPPLGTTDSCAGNPRPATSAGAAAWSYIFLVHPAGCLISATHCAAQSLCPRAAPASPTMPIHQRCHHLTAESTCPPTRNALPPDKVMIQQCQQAGIRALTQHT